MSKTSEQDSPKKPAGSGPRKISAKAFLTDVCAGVDDADLMERHDLTVSGLWRTFEMLVNSGVLKAAELDERRTRAAAPAWKCPACGMSHQIRGFDTCPRCGD